MDNDAELAAMQSEAEQLFRQIDGLAKDYDQYDFGLPYAGHGHETIIAAITAALGKSRLDGLTAALECVSKMDPHPQRAIAMKAIRAEMEKAHP